MIYIGIDPGLDGAIAIFNEPADTLIVHDMPTYEVTKNGKKRREVNAQEVANILRCGDVRQIKRKLIIELSGARPGDGAIQAHRTGVNWGVVYGVVVALNISHSVVSPQAWKKAMKATADKDLSRRRACEEWPDYTNQFSRKKDHGRAEAALMAKYAYRLMLGAFIP